MFRELPLATAHMRMRLRLSRLYLTLIGHAVVIVALAIILRLSGEQNWLPSCVGVCLLVQYLCLAVGGCNAIGYGISQEIKSGLLSFHRLTPMSPDAILLGYIFGMASRSYLAWAMWAVAGFLFWLPSAVSPLPYLAISGMIVLSAFYFQLVTALSTLMVPARLETKHKATSPSILLPICFPFVPVDTIFLTPIPLALQFFTPDNMAPDLRQWLLQVYFFQATWPAAVYSLFLLVVLGTLTYFVARYKIAFENRPAFSKRHALFIAFTLFVIIIGRTMQYVQRPDPIPGLFFYLVCGFSFITISFIFGIIPKRLLIRQHCVRLVEEKCRDPWWHDAAPAMQATLALVGLCIASQNIVAGLLPPVMQEMVRHSLLMHNGLLVVLAVCLVGLCEGCRIHFAKDANSVIVVVLAIWWLFPPILFTMDHGQVGHCLLGISPLAGFVSACIPDSMPQLVATTSIAVTSIAALGALFFRQKERHSLMRKLRENTDR
jgi:hypothetical protein